MTRQNHKRGFNLSSSSSNAVGQPCKGFSLIEAAFVLAVVGGVIGAIWVAASNFYENYKVNKTAEGILTTARNIQNLISIRDAELISAVEVDITSSGINAEVFPNDWVDGNTVKSPFGGRVDISINPSESRLGINLSNIPRSACIKLTVKVTSIGSLSGSLGSGPVNRTSLGYMNINTAPNWHTTVFPVSPQEAETACNQVSNRIFFAYGLTRINN